MQSRSGKVCHDGVRMGQGVGITAGTAADFSRSDGDDVVFMGLLGRRQLLQGIAQESTQAAPVLQDVLGPVTDVKGQIERCKRCFAHAAALAGHAVAQAGPGQEGTFFPTDSVFMFYPLRHDDLRKYGSAGSRRNRES